MGRGAPTSPNPSGTASAGERPYARGRTGTLPVRYRIGSRYQSIHSATIKGPLSCGETGDRPGSSMSGLCVPGSLEYMMLATKASKEEKGVPESGVTSRIIMERSRSKCPIPKACPNSWPRVKSMSLSGHWAKSNRIVAETISYVMG